MHYQWAINLMDNHPTVAGFLGLLYIAALVFAALAWWLTTRGKE